MSLPLTGIRVLDLSNVLAGPFCGYHLSRLGAEVIKIENPNGGDLARRLGSDPQRAERLQGLSFVAVNAGKQSVALDLKSESGREVFLRLVTEADVVLENFRPKVMERLGLGFDVLCKHNPLLVYCAISGFGHSGPWSARPAYDQIVQGLSGAMSVTGDTASAPLRTGFPISDTIAGLTAAFAISAALVEQRRTGRGRFIDVSLLEATVAAMGWVVSNYLNAGVEPQPMGNENFTAAPSGTFSTETGPLNISANEQKQYQALCDLIGRPELKTDPRFAKREMRKVNRAALNAELNEALSRKPAEEWELQMNAAGVPAGCVLTVAQILRQPQLLDRRFVETLPPEQAGAQPLRITRPGFRLNEEFPVPSPPPTLGADTERWLQRLGYSAEAIAELVASGAVAGKTVGRTTGGNHER
ncbi:CaiB/BaiF CoA transferase family protein [Bradyrhizobium sp. CCBAU 11361]|uniref:CaiB/BaiF CoA transferase family protein n=1 Tax=Bradyrhizobium sp. CCBAU 11361 TaxID=1630812 RepID=UPI0023024CEE|nr:CoA transferase [Bradyrhizobium sp. CCBAU 11361]MDA9490323.1 CoA-transferase [Bradyrhizobium sp. CCBAU 11361]MDA9491080.1 CoA-transferase [Bradyrhizobium sp. CCBAU 11361]